MSNLILDPNDKPLINPAHDKFLDAPMTRREAQKAFDHFSYHMDQLYATGDTQHIVLNLIGEKLNITKGEILAYVEKKRQEIEVAKKLNDAAKELAKQQEAAGEQSN
jgi:hypothetical protein